jgi:hypothetical protein
MITYHSTSTSNKYVDYPQKIKTKTSMLINKIYLLLLFARSVVSTISMPTKSAIKCGHRDTKVELLKAQGKPRTSRSGISFPLLLKKFLLDQKIVFLDKPKMFAVQ